ncbi:hypothetical protein R84981_002888 [Carnimonas sp. R-84981]|uniref:structural cement protein Gp24 n=1 Tax=Carnimonas bestiolae TaxID=3402172 RepID=UPI003EDBB6DF
MAIAQSNFNKLRGVGYEGMQSTIDVNDVLSRRNDGDNGIAFGRVVIRGDGDQRSCEAFDANATAADVIGVAVRSLAQPSVNNPYGNASGNTDYDINYAPGQHVSVLRRGRVYVLSVDGASAGDTVKVISTGDDIGRLTGPDGEGVELNQVHWVEDVEAGQIGEIQLDALLHIEATSSSQSVSVNDVSGLQDALNKKLDADGTAASATKLANARKIAGKSFDGTKDISIAASDVGAQPASDS